MADLIVKSTYLESGFYNSVSGDRKYTAEQMGRLVDGIITEGVFPNVGDELEINWGASLPDSRPYRRFTIGKGKAWLNNKWIFNNNIETFDISSAVYRSGNYYLYLVLNLSIAGRKAEFILSDENITPPNNIVNDVAYYKMARIVYDSENGITNLTSYIGDEDILPYVKMNVIPEENDHNEIVDARTGFDDINYDTLGDSIRGQCSSIDSRVKDAAYYHIWATRSESLNFTTNDVVYIDTPLSNGNYGYFVCLNPTIGSTLSDGADWSRYWTKLTISGSISGILKTIKYSDSNEDCYIYNSVTGSALLPKGAYVLLEKQGIGSAIPAGLYKAKVDSAPIGVFGAGVMSAVLSLFEPTSILTEIRKIFKNDWSKISTETLSSGLSVGAEMTTALSGSYDNLKIVLTNPGSEVGGVRLSITYDSTDGLTDQKAFYDGSNVSFPANGYLYCEIETVDDMKHTLSCRANGGTTNKYLHANNPGKINSVKFKILSSGTAGLPAGTKIEIYGKNNISNII